MAKAKSADGSMVYQLKVTLQGSKPPIWRRIQVRGSTTMERFHIVLQRAMGWSNSHLYAFEETRPFGSSWSRPTEIGKRKRLDQVMTQEKDRIIYEYDFGDSWSHLIVLEKILEPQPDATYPVCLTGKRACPPEDVGGIGGYYYCLEAVSDPNHPEHEVYLEWLFDGEEPDDFDPDAFDLDEVNRRLR